MAIRDQVQLHIYVCVDNYRSVNGRRKYNSFLYSSHKCATYYYEFYIRKVSSAFRAQLYMSLLVFTFVFAFCNRYQMMTSDMTGTTEIGYTYNGSISL